MGLEKAIFHGKEKRKEYQGSKRFDRSCRNHGGCAWCEGNRLFKFKKYEEKSIQELKEFVQEFGVMVASRSPKPTVEVRVL